jgi:glycosyltransferase involved in cell wall biosynthesis
MKELVLISTGIGHVQRGFEVYIHTLANKLVSSFELEVYGGGDKLNDALYDYHKVWTIKRNAFLYKFFRVSESKKLALEQFFFFVGMLRFRSGLKNKVFYLGEYQLYCYLYKLRAFLGLNFNLVLYTGGQAAPGIFDNKKDFVHHITNVYLDYTSQVGISLERQFLIPHFVAFDFTIDQGIVSAIKEKAKGRKIVLSIGTLDFSIKQMHLIPALLKEVANEVFVILLGSQTAESHLVKLEFEKVFDKEQYEFIAVKHDQVGNYLVAADVLVQCSKRESFGLVYLEAAYFNVPIITNDFEEVRYVLGTNAFFLPMDNIEFSSKSIKDFFNSIPEVKTRQWVVSQYDWISLRDKYIDMFNKMMV